MSRQQWKINALLLAALLMSVLILIFTTPLSTKVLAQKTVRQCGISPTDSSFLAAQSLVEKYGVDICKQDKFTANDTQTRAEMASLLASVVESLNQITAKSVEKLPKKNELASLNQVLDRITAQVEALEK